MGIKSMGAIALPQVIIHTAETSQVNNWFRITIKFHYNSFGYRHISSIVTFGCQQFSFGFSLIMPRAVMAIKKFELIEQNILFQCKRA